MCVDNTLAKMQKQKVVGHGVDHQDRGGGRFNFNEGVSSKIQS